MRVLPVLDIFRGQVVHGVAGRRTEYGPVVSQLTNSSDPFEIANRIREVFGLHQFYVADLDGIVQQRPNLALYRQMMTDRFELFLDAGIRQPGDLDPLLDQGVTQVIVGLESCRSPRDLAELAAKKVDLTFSLDLLEGQPCLRQDCEGWSSDPQEIVRQAVEANVKSILPLDLSDVGMGTGGSTDRLCRFIRDAFPSLGLITGGGIRGLDDLKRLRQLGIDAALVASALHDGTLTREDIQVVI